MKRNEKTKRSKNSPKVESAIAAWRNEAAQPSDVLGWYTGIPSEENDLMPEQDSDDL